MDPYDKVIHGQHSLRGRIILVCCAVLVVTTIVVRPLALKRTPSGDFMTIFSQTNHFWKGEVVYAGANPYLPSTYVVMAYQVFLSPQAAWLVWRVLGMSLVGALALAAYRPLAADLGSFRAGLALTNILLLSGMSPWSGNPGNLAGIGIVLSYFVLARGKPILGGILLGLACSVKYSLGLPFVFLAAASRQWRFAATGVAIFIIVNAIGLTYAWLHGTALVAIVHSLLNGVLHVGGYEQAGFDKWFGGRDPYRFQLLNATPLLNSFGVDGTVANLMCLTALLFGLFAALRCAAANRAGFLSSAAILCPYFLLCTYHRFYDSGILGLTITFAWLHYSKRIHLYGWSIIVASCAIFLSLSNILQTRASNGMIDLHSWWWNYVIGPHHVYALALMAIAMTMMAARHTHGRQMDASVAAKWGWP